jgi:glutathione-specific gamma-glutamylcyclotransferase
MAAGASGASRPSAFAPVRSPLPSFDPRRIDAERLSTAALERSLDAILAARPPGQPIWVFAYGSLMWNPGLGVDVRHVVTLFGYHRSFRLWSRINRGTPECPGLVLTLERGGSCRGLAYRLKPGTARADLLDLWRREMSLDSYRPRWLDCRAGADRIPALVFVGNRGCSGYAGSLPIETMVHALATAKGKFGSSAEYLFRTQATLAEHGIRDTRVEQLAHRVRAHLAAKGEPARFRLAPGGGTTHCA